MNKISTAKSAPSRARQGQWAAVLLTMSNLYSKYCEGVQYSGAPLPQVSQGETQKPCIYAALSPVSLTRSAALDSNLVLFY